MGQKENVQFVQVTTEQLENLIDARQKKLLEDLKKVIDAQNTNDEILTRQQTAKLFHVCIKTIDNWRDKGIIPDHPIEGKTYFFRSELVELLKNKGYGK
jgi:hypothetical protein